jgi:mannosyltransferase OCH1-like enzyme
MHSPTTTTAPWSPRNRLPSQIRRVLPAYIACILLIFFLANADFFVSSIKSANKHKRDLSHQTPIKQGTKFPKKIWQTWKVGPLGFEERDSTTARTWVAKNPSHRYEVLTDDNDMQYVETHFGSDGLNRLDIVDMYRNLNARIVKADLLRYLIMYVEGGVYADIDVEALRSVDRFIPDRYDEGDVDMVIGVEVDQPEFNNHAILGKKSQSFCQWTFMCKPRLPVMMTLIDNILTWLNDVAAKQNVPVSEVVLDFDEVLSGTGPSAFTIAVLEDMSRRKGEPVTWDTFHNMAESKLVSGVLVLTVEAFAAGQGHSDSGNHNARTALVKHHYHASGWPTNHPRFHHPVFGEVERCNWDADCVRKWDEDTAAFELLSPEEKQKQIAMKEAADAAALQPPPLPAQLVPMKS